nr:unnamed protein product [Callosobruchus analis]
MHVKRGQKSYWKCSNYKTDCRARLVDEGNRIILNQVEHNHAPMASNYEHLKSRIVYITPGTKNPKLIVECNDYSVYLKQNDKTRWRCNAYFKTKCKATLLTYGKVVRMNHQHNHYPMLAKGGFDRSYPQRVHIIRSSSH